MGCACQQKRQQAAAEASSKALGAVMRFTDTQETTAPAVMAYDKDIALEPVLVPEDQVKSVVAAAVKNNGNVAQTSNVDPVKELRQSKASLEVVKEALENNLTSCYLCAKKHLVRAQIFFEEYHTGYPDHIKNLVQSLRVAEVQVRGAFLRWQKVMGHLDMAANELLGNDINAVTMNKEHIILANKIRDARIRLSDNPLASINFDDLITKVHLLQYRELEKQ